LITANGIKESTAGERAPAPWPASGAQFTGILIAEGQTHLGF